MNRWERLALTYLATNEHKPVWMLRILIEQKLIHAVEYGNEAFADFLYGKTRSFSYILRCRRAERFWRAVWEAFVVLYPEYAFGGK